MNPGRERSRRASWRTRCKVSRFAILDTGGLCSERFGFFPSFSARSFSRSSNTTFPFGRRKPRSLPDRGQKRATHSQRDRQTKKMAWSASVAPKVDELQMLDCTNGQISSSCERGMTVLGDFFVVVAMPGTVSVVEWEGAVRTLRSCTKSGCSVIALPQCFSGSSVRASW